jgi:hypothetical protein
MAVAGSAKVAEVKVVAPTAEEGAMVVAGRVEVAREAAAAVHTHTGGGGRSR